MPQRRATAGRLQTLAAHLSQSSGVGKCGAAASASDDDSAKMMGGPPVDAARPRPLDGVKVIDLGNIYNGPYCGFLLSQAGADVVKVEARPQEILTTARSTGDVPDRLRARSRPREVTARAAYPNREVGMLPAVPTARCASRSRT